MSAFIVCQHCEQNYNNFILFFYVFYFLKQLFPTYISKHANVKKSTKI